MFKTVGKLEAKQLERKQQSTLKQLYDSIDKLDREYTESVMLQKKMRNTNVSTFS